MKAIDYREALPKEQRELILDLYARGKSVKEVAYIAESTRYVVERFLMQSNNYIYESDRKEKTVAFKEKLIKRPFSTNEWDYGHSGSSKYKWEELDSAERRLTKHKDHKELRTGYLNILKQL